VSLYTHDKSKSARARTMYITAYMAMYMPLYVMVRAHTVMVDSKSPESRKSHGLLGLRAFKPRYGLVGRNLANDARNLAFWLRNLANSLRNLAFFGLTSQPFCWGARTYVKSARLRPDHATHMRARTRTRMYIAHIEVAGK